MHCLRISSLALPMARSVSCKQGPSQRACQARHFSPEKRSRKRPESDGAGHSLRYPPCLGSYRARRLTAVPRMPVLLGQSIMQWLSRTLGAHHQRSATAAATGGGAGHTRLRQTRVGSARQRQLSCLRRPRASSHGVARLRCTGVLSARQALVPAGGRLRQLPWLLRPARRRTVGGETAPPGGYETFVGSVPAPLSGISMTRC